MAPSVSSLLFAPSLSATAYEVYVRYSKKAGTLKVTPVPYWNTAPPASLLSETQGSEQGKLQYFVVNAENTGTAVENTSHLLPQNCHFAFLP